MYPGLHRAHPGSGPLYAKQDAVFVIGAGDNRVAVAADGYAPPQVVTILGVGRL